MSPTLWINATTMKSMNIKHTKKLFIGTSAICMYNKTPSSLAFGIGKDIWQWLLRKMASGNARQYYACEARGNSSTIERHPAPGSQTRMQNRVHPLLSLPITNVLVGLLRNCLACVWPAPLKLVSALSVCWATIFFFSHWLNWILSALL